MGVCLGGAEGEGAKEGMEERRMVKRAQDDEEG